ncbi:MAG: hypothetical protein JNL62_09475, partial [Bryobacterales bacterium]|nr:hypothetical protein [Bryobacterales bacterium]
MRRQWLSEGSRLEAKRHAAECVACRESVDRERTLTAALGEVASQREMTGAPVHVEASVMAAFAAKHPPRRSMMWRAAAWAIPLAAGLLLFTLVLILGSALYLLYSRGVFDATQRLVLTADDSEGVSVG